MALIMNAPSLTSALIIVLAALVPLTSAPQTEIYSGAITKTVTFLCSVPISMVSPDNSLQIYLGEEMVVASAFSYGETKVGEMFIQRAPQATVEGNITEGWLKVIIPDLTDETLGNYKCVLHHVQSSGHVKYNRSLTVGRQSSGTLYSHPMGFKATVFNKVTVQCGTSLCDPAVLSSQMNASSNNSTKSETSLASDRATHVEEQSSESERYHLLWIIPLSLLVGAFLKPLACIIYKHRNHFFPCIFIFVPMQFFDLSSPNTNESISENDDLQSIQIDSNTTKEEMELLVKPPECDEGPSEKENGASAMASVKIMKPKDRKPFQAVQEEEGDIDTKL